MPASVRMPAGLRLAFLIALALVLALAAFANAAARNGAAIPAFSALGTGFHGWRAAHARAERALVARPGVAAAERSRAISTRVLASEPLAVPAWRSLALADAASGAPARARAVMEASHDLSRRDPFVQAWLIDAGIRRQDVSATLAHFDALLRTEPEARGPLLGRLIGVLGNAAARRDLARFVSDDTPWYPEFAGLAAQRSPRMAPMASVLVAADQIPDAPVLREIYGGIVERLVREGEFDLLRQLYPRLPGARAATLSTLALDEAGQPLYPPLGWSMINEPDRNAALVDSNDGTGAGAIEALAEPLITGTVARRLVYPPADARQISWRVGERNGWRDSTATIQLRCLDAVAVSGNLFDRRAPASLTLPRPCPVAMLELQMFGGTGRDPAMILIDRISFQGPAATSRSGS